jgi:hypothetical protein
LAPSLSKSSNVWLTTHSARTGAIDLVDDDDRLQPLLQRLHRDETSLRHRSFNRVDEQQHAIHHAQHAPTSPPKSACPGVSTMLM